MSPKHTYIEHLTITMNNILIIKLSISHITKKTLQTKQTVTKIIVFQCICDL